MAEDDGLRFEDLANPAMGRLNDIDKVSGTDIDNAANDVVSAAIKAREQEIRVWAGSGSGVEDSSGNLLPEFAVGEGDYSWIPSHFKRFYERPLGEAINIADGLKMAKTALDDGRTQVFGSASDAVSAWAGEARNDYKENFLDKFPNAIARQGAILDDIRVGCIVYEGVQRGGRKEAKAIADASKKSLDGLFGCGGDSPEAKLGYTMLGVAAWIAGTVAGGPSGLILGLTLVGAGSFAAGGIASYEPENGPSIGGGSVQEILDNMVTKLNELQDNMYKEEEALSSSMNTSQGEVESYLTSDSAGKQTTILPNGGNDENIADLTDGEMPPTEEFRPKEQPR